MEKINCCICGEEIEGWENNPAGAMWRNEAGQVIEPTYNNDARCCNECNMRYVIPGRLYLLSKNRK